MRSFSTLVAVLTIAFGTIGCGSSTTAPGAADPETNKGTPPAGAEKDIVATAVGNDDFKTLVTALKAAELVEALQDDGPFTVFAPTNAAFEKSVPADKLQELLKPENKEKLAAVLKYHVVSGKVMAADAMKMDGKEAETLEGSKLKITVKDGTVMVDGATVTKADIECKNGVIHVIDSVVMPKAK